MWAFKELGVCFFFISLWVGSEGNILRVVLFISKFCYVLGGFAGVEIYLFYRWAN